MVEKVEKKGLKLGGRHPKLTPSEKKILDLLTKEFLTVQQASIRCKCTIQAIYKIRASLKKKGFLDANVPKEIMVEKNEGYIQPFNHIRLHAEQFVLRIIWKDHTKYEAGTRVKIEGNSVKLNKESIEVYSNTSFLGETPAVCDAKALLYWEAFFNKLQSKFKVILLKNGYLNIKRVRAEYAETNNELAKKCVEEAQKIRVYGDDGKQWLVFDNSYNLKEAETVHPQLSRFDMEDVVQPFFNDLRRSPATLGDVKAVLLDLARQNRETAAGLSAVVELLRPRVAEKEEEWRGRVDYVG